MVWWCFATSLPERLVTIGKHKLFSLLDENISLWIEAQKNIMNMQQDRPELKGQHTLESAAAQIENWTTKMCEFVDFPYKI